MTQCDMYGEPLFHCRARMRMASVAAPSRVSKAVLAWLIALLLLACFTAFRYGMRGGDEMQCFLIFLFFMMLPILSLTLSIVRPGEMGKLFLYDGELVFRHATNSRRVEIALKDIERIGRKRRVIHVAKKAKRDTIYFTCPGLRGEDFYDRILAQIDALELDVVHHERKR